MDALDEMVKRLCDIEIRRRENCAARMAMRAKVRSPQRCVECNDGRLVAQGASPAAICARKYQLCQRCYNDKATRNARRIELGLGPWRRHATR